MTERARFTIDEWRELSENACPDCISITILDDSDTANAGGLVVAAALRAPVPAIL